MVLQLVPTLVITMLVILAITAPESPITRDYRIELVFDSSSAPQGDFTVDDFEMLSRPSANNLNLSPAESVHTTIATFYKPSGTFSIIIWDQNTSRPQPTYLNVTNAYLIGDEALQGVEVTDSNYTLSTDSPNHPISVNLYEVSDFTLPIIDLIAPADGPAAFRFEAHLATYGAGLARLSARDPILYINDSVDGTAYVGSTTIETSSSGNFVWSFSVMTISNLRMLGGLIRLDSPSFELRNLFGEVKSTDGVVRYSPHGDSVSGTAKSVSIVAHPQGGDRGLDFVVESGELLKGPSGTPIEAIRQPVEMWVNAAAMVSAWGAFSFFCYWARSGKRPKGN